MKKSKKTYSVPGDVPAVILKEFLPEFALPVTAIIKEAISTHTWPDQHKKEYHLPLKKIPSPLTEDDLRGIGLTSWISKQLKRLMLDWIWPYIEPHIDKDQMGGVPGCSIEHYVVKMMDFVLKSLDGDSDAAVLSVAVDYRKAFNRMLHSNILCSQSALNVPICAIRIIKLYLTQRSMCVRYNGAESNLEKCPGGGPQGGLLTCVFFILQVNKAGSPCSLTRIHLPILENPGSRNIEAISTNQGQSELPALRNENTNPQPCQNQKKLHKKSYIDDLTLLEKISLLDLQLKKRIIGPLDYHDRFNLTLPPEKSILQHQLLDLIRYTAKQSMVLNEKKTKCLPFILSQTKDFQPELSLEEGKYLEVVYRLKLVGLVISSSLTWNEHINYTVKRVNSILWQLTRFKQAGGSQEKLLKFYILKIRSILMFGAVCYHSSLNLEQRNILELQQKRSLVIILGSDYRSYSQARSHTNLPELNQLREEACVKWALKAQASQKHTHLFPLNPSEVNTRHRNKFSEPTCKTSRYFNSPVPSMIRSLNRLSRAE